jgi:2-polyprenyl-6-methoxyphenol hydroxylase-like FAD-dependent oxidoreductase
MRAQTAEVLVVGAGPVGLAMAAELARHGISVRIIDKQAAPLPFCRAIGVTPRTLEVLEDMGVARDLIDGGIWLRGTRMEMQGAPARDVLHDFSDLPYASLGVPQYTTEAVLARHLATFGVDVERGVELTGVETHGDHVEVGLNADGVEARHRFRYVVGCDGAHSLVRKALGIGFEGSAMPAEFMLGDVRIDWDLPRGLAFRATRTAVDAPPDFLVAIPLPGHGRYRVSTLAPAEPVAEPDGEWAHGIQADRPGPTLAELQAVADRLLEKPATLSDLRWSSRFRISMRLADSYGDGRAFIAGDACHIHPPTGGQGMNTGIQDAYNLAWKLALVARGLAGPRLLDTYGAERRAVAADVVARTTEQSLSLGKPPATPPNRLQDTQVLIDYRDGPLSVSNGGGAISAGLRVPDVQGLRREGLNFPLRLFDLLKGPSFVLLLADGADAEAAAAALESSWPGLVRVIAIGADAGAQLEGVEVIRDADGQFASVFAATPGAGWLIRPDKYVGLDMRAWSLEAVAAYLRDTVGLRRAVEPSSQPIAAASH